MFGVPQVGMVDVQVGGGKVDVNEEADAAFEIVGDVHMLDVE